MHYLSPGARSPPAASADFRAGVIAQPSFWFVAGAPFFHFPGFCLTGVLCGASTVAPAGWTASQPVLGSPSSVVNSWHVSGLRMVKAMYASGACRSFWQVESVCRTLTSERTVSGQYSTSAMKNPGSLTGTPSRIQGPRMESAGLCQPW